MARHGEGSSHFQESRFICGRAETYPVPGGCDESSSHPRIGTEVSGASPSINNPSPPGGQLFAWEAGLPQGSAPNPADTDSSWVFTIQSPDGVGALTVGGYQAISSGVFTAGSADLGYGRLTVRAYDAASGQVSVDFVLTAATHRTRLTAATRRSNSSMDMTSAPSCRSPGSTARSASRRGGCWR